MDGTINLGKTESGPVVFMGKRGLTPDITAGEDGTLYVDGQILTESVKNAITAANAAAEAAQEAADNIAETIGDINSILDNINVEVA